jgi:hypothetical protein
MKTEIIACVMNVISHRAAYSLYPTLTFERRCSLICATQGADQKAAREKYIQRGWAMVEVPELSDTKASLLASTRRVGDCHCWTIPLPAISTDTRMPFDPLTTGTWSLQDNSKLQDEFGVRHQAEMQFAVLEAPFLKWRYTLEMELYPYVQYELEKVHSAWRAANEIQSRENPRYVKR